MFGLPSFIDVKSCFGFSNKISGYLGRAYDVPNTTLIFGAGGCSDRPLLLSRGYLLIVFLGRRGR